MSLKTSEYQCIEFGRIKIGPQYIEGSIGSENVFERAGRDCIWAMLRVTFLYRGGFGSGIIPNQTKAVEWANKICKKNPDVGKLLLSIFNREGIVVTKLPKIDEPPVDHIDRRMVDLVEGLVMIAKGHKLCSESEIERAKECLPSRVGYRTPTMRNKIVDGEYLLLEERIRVMEIPINDRWVDKWDRCIEKTAHGLAIEKYLSWKGREYHPGIYSQIIRFNEQYYMSCMDAIGVHLFYQNGITAVRTCIIARVWRNSELLFKAAFCFPGITGEIVKLLTDKAEKQRSDYLKTIGYWESKSPRVLLHCLNHNKAFRLVARDLRSTIYRLF